MSKLTDTAMSVLRERYFIKGEDSWEELSSRVSSAMASTEEEESIFNSMIYDLDFLPNSPCLMNAGTDISSFSACYVLPVEDNIESIYKYYSDAAIIGKSGGGVGANFSKLRAANAKVKSTDGVASGPLSFMSVQNQSTEVIKQGGKRRGANMGILDCDHPDVLDFIRAKGSSGVLENFNVSVRCDDEFMKESYTPFSNANRLLGEIVVSAHRSGEPGILFGDRIEQDNVLPDYLPLDATNPCGEQPLFPYESCVLGSINLSNHVKNKEIDYKKLQQTIRNAVLFLNRVLDNSSFPLPELNAAKDYTRKIGLGIMGLHDMLIQCDIAYDSDAGRLMAGDVMSYVRDVSNTMSEELGEIEGCYKACEDFEDAPKRRNACLTTIAPTGTLSMIADCSSGCEPYFAPVSYKTILDGTTFTMPNKWISLEMADRGTTFEEIMEAKGYLYKGAQDIHWQDHVLMQAELQKYVDSSISKTINMPAEATTEDVRDAYRLAYSSGCKGITVYRDGCRGAQVMNTSEGSVGDQELPPVYKLELEDKLEAIRHRVVDANSNKVYFTVCTQDDDPVEVFARLPYEAQDSYWNTICRLLSLCMRYRVPLDDITKQLRKGATSVVDMPAKLARILDEYKDEDDSHPDRGMACPDCDARLTMQGGCESCSECGYSKCG